jgi:hypothetical protein
VRQNGVNILQEAKFFPVWKDNAKAPDVRAAMIERVAGYLERSRD